MEGLKSVRNKIICLFFLVTLSSFLSEGATINVTRNGSIMKAIESVNPSDTIIVNAGTYFENNLVIKKPITLKGNNAVLDGENKYEIISVWSSDVTIEGFKIQHGGRSSLNDLA